MGTADSTHRAFPPPSGPWMMSQRWEHLLFAHWPVPAATMRARLPAGLELDLFDGSAWLTITPFMITGLRMRGLPALPWGSDFPELNVRTYVTVGGKAGVYFFSLDAGSSLAVEAARMLYHLPYLNARMSIEADPAGAVAYHSVRTDRRGPPAELRASYRPTGSLFASRPGTIEHFLTERYCLYVVDARGRVVRAEIHHAPWPLQPGEVILETNTMTGAAGFEVDGPPRAVTYTREIDVLVWRKQVVR